MLEAESEFAPPPGFALQKVTVQTGPDGKIERQWPRYAPNADLISLAIETLKHTFEEYKGRAELTPPPENFVDDLAVGFIIGDAHFGGYADILETKIANWDTKIAERMHLDAMRDLVNSMPATRNAFILGLGDFIHFDTASGTTTAGTQVDVDSRRSRVCRSALVSARSMIELALQKYQEIEVEFLPGNHDEFSAPWLALGLWSWFHNEPRVKINCDPSFFWKWTFGRNLIVSYHGNNARPKNAPEIMARDFPKEWGESDHRYALVGHTHHIDKFRKGGATVEAFETLCPPDAWHKRHGYGAGPICGRSMTAIAFHKDYGERYRTTVTAQQLERR
jgi:hypothetical protein